MSSDLVHRESVQLIALLCALVFLTVACESPTERAESLSEPDERAAQDARDEEVTGELEIQAAGVTARPSSFGDGFEVTAGAAIFNPTDLVAEDVRVNVNLLDEQGSIVQSESELIPYVTPGSEAYTATDWFLDDSDPEPVDVDVQIRVSMFSERNIADFSFENLRYRSTDFGGRMAGEITSQFSEDISDVRVACALFQDGELIGTGYTFVDFVPGGATTGFDGQNGLIGGLDPDEVKCYATLSYLSQ